MILTSCKKMQDLWKAEGGDDPRTNQMPLQQHLQQPLAPQAMMQPPPLQEHYVPVPQVDTVKQEGPAAGEAAAPQL